MAGELREAPRQPVLVKVRQAVRRRATGRDGVVRCQRCGSMEGPYDVHHTTRLSLSWGGTRPSRPDAVLVSGCHEFRHGMDPTNGSANVGRTGRADQATLRAKPSEVNC